MTEQDNDRYLTADQAADILGTSGRTVHRYGEAGQIRTRKTGRRVMFHEGDIHQLARDLQTQRRGPDPDEVDRLREMVQQASYRIGYLEAQLERRLLPDHEMQLRDELAAQKTRVETLQGQLDQAQAQIAGGVWQRWALVALLVLVAILVTVLVIVLIRPAF
jgi:excisionase family DNA binding protein